MANCFREEDEVMVIPITGLCWCTGGGAPLSFSVESAVFWLLEPLWLSESVSELSKTTGESVVLSSSSVVVLFAVVELVAFDFLKKSTTTMEGGRNGRKIMSTTSKTGLRLLLLSVSDSF